MAEVPLKGAIGYALSSSASRRRNGVLDQQLDGMVKQCRFQVGSQMTGDENSDNARKKAFLFM